MNASTGPQADRANPNALKVCKFGGTSLAQASQIAKAAAIVRADDARAVVVPSAPGKRTPTDAKITDRLYQCHHIAALGDDITGVFKPVRDRFLEIAAGLGLGDQPAWLTEALDAAAAGIAEQAAAGRDSAFAASRGEYLNGRVFAALLDWPFIDAADVVKFGRNDRLEAQSTYDAIAAAVHQVGGRAVIPGFYGSDAAGHVRTFSRGGSDVTGAIVARALHASVYENWTDVSGLLMTDPRIVDAPATIDTLTYRELRELSYMGATVLHPEAVFPVREAGIPVHIRNTNDPDHPGTQIVAPGSEPPMDAASFPITGIAGRKDFTIIALEKALMNNEVGYGEKVLGVLRRAGISFEHMPSGIDTLSIVVEDAQLEGKLDDVVATLKREVEPDTLEVDPDLALIATVGRNMKTHPGMAARVFGALGQAGVNIRMIDQGSSELNIIVGVDASDFETAVRAIYDAFVP
ncbi:MAG: aspartate kinase [Planctomycetota bacterium]